MIDAIAAKNYQHINKHQLVRKVLENNPQIFEDKSEIIWREFQNIENRLRPKFSYGFSWNEEDFKNLKYLLKKVY